MKVGHSMASGCILNLACPICDEIVWEDNWVLAIDEFVHFECQKLYIMRSTGISQKQFNKLYGIDDLKAQVNAFKAWAIDTADDLLKKIKHLEDG